MKPEVFKTRKKDEIIMRALFDVPVAIIVSPHSGINPGDRFLSPNDGSESLIIGHSNASVFRLKDPSVWGLEGEFFWAIKKNESIIGCFGSGGEAFNLICNTILKAESPMTAETAEETINNFLDS